MFHGTADTLVSPIASKMLQIRLEAAGVPAQRYILKDAGHGTPEFDQDIIEQRVVDFLNIYANSPISTAAPVIDYALGTKSYEPNDLPTLEEATADAEVVEASQEKWIIDQAKGIDYKAVKGGSSYKTLKMNLLIPSHGGKEEPARPVLYCAACGGFNTSNPDTLKYLHYAERGYIVAVSEIRVAPSVTMPAPLQDAKAGVRWLRAHADDFGIDPNCIIATGSSAGGYTGVMLGVLGNTTQYSDDVVFDIGDNLDQSSAVQGVVDLYGVSDLTIIGAGLPNYDVHDSESNTEALWVNGTVFGKNPGGSVFNDLEKTAVFSPFTYLDKNDAPLLSFHGTDDVIVSPISTMELHKRCLELGVASERYSFVGVKHGGWQMETDRALKIIDDFMDNIVASCASKES